ncbi:MAG: NAD(+)--dinitrogen-reductase ADP-D-ribosyltransferase [Pseudomonadota bacterium]
MTTPNASRLAYDKDPMPCRCSDIREPTIAAASPPALPAGAVQSFNHCNLPSRLLASLLFQRHPVQLELDGVLALHRRLFAELDALAGDAQRAELFRVYMNAHFCLQHPEEAGAGNPAACVRPRANYLRILRGWGFSAEQREGAVLKGWVESRFGLLTRYHAEAMPDSESAAYARFVAQRSAGLYGAHALEAQLDLVYSYVQYELARRYPQRSHFLLYRGINQPKTHELLQSAADGSVTLLLNNLSSFTLNRERADEFGDSIIEICVPRTKVFCHYGLLPGLLPGEDEMMVIGGMYLGRVVSARLS